MYTVKLVQSLKNATQTDVPSDKRTPNAFRIAFADGQELLLNCKSPDVKRKWMTCVDKALRDLARREKSFKKTGVRL